MLLGQISAVRFAKDRKNNMQSLEMPFGFSENIVLDVFYLKLGCSSLSSSAQLTRKRPPAVVMATARKTEVIATSIPVLPQTTKNSRNSGQVSPHTQIFIAGVLQFCLFLIPPNWPTMSVRGKTILQGTSLLCTDRLAVVARIRPLLDKELDKDTIVRAESGGDGKTMNIVRIPNPKNEAEEFSFSFNGVYDMDTTQEELFTNEGTRIVSTIIDCAESKIVAPHLKSLFQGLDVTIFAYGVTGTGKTHTMRGGLKLAERGVIPRLLSGIYRRGKKITKDSGGETEVTVTLSYYEIYNDKVYDLFEPPDKRSLAGLPLREKDGKTVVVGLSERACDDLKDFERLYIEANNNRSTAGTKLNAQSSRSHAILMVRVIQTNGDETLISTASAIDLAGSEDNRRTENNKERLVESASINKSLFVLSSCIDAIGRGDKRIP
jgi:hypothetical protein